MTHPLYFEELQPGERWRSLGRTITQADAARFAGLTGDATPLHIDHEFAKESAYRGPSTGLRTGPVAHGLLGLSLLEGLGQQSPAVSLLSLLAVRQWTARLPLFVGDTVHVVTEVLTKTARTARDGTIVWRRQLINQRGELVQEGIFESLVALAHTGTHDAFRRVEPSRDEPSDRGFRSHAA